MAFHGITKPAVFMFLLVTVGLSASAIAAGIAERENRVYDVSRVQDQLIDLAREADERLDHEERAIGILIQDVTEDLQRVHRVTRTNAVLIDRIVAHGSNDGKSQPRRAADAPAR